MTMIASHGAFEIMADLAAPSTLSEDELIEFFCRMVEL